MTVVTRLALPLALLAALFAFSSSALAAGKGAGHNAPTRALEKSFSISLSARINSKKGCYPSERKLARMLAKKGKLRTGIAGGPGSARERNVVYVLRKGTTCNGVRLALRPKRKIVYVMDSLKGEIRVLGRKRKGKDPAIAGNKGPLRDLFLASRTVRMKKPNRRIRHDIRCPGRTFPLGGGMVSTPGVGGDGEGVYPHSYERLGAQSGWHITAWLADPSAGAKPFRDVTLQVMCARGLVPMSSPHKTLFVKPRKGPRTITARCPRGQYLMSGGFQRTDFLADGGNYITESRASSPTSWTVSARAHGRYGGELTAIAYCVKAAAPLLTEVSANIPVPFFQAASVTTPACPDGRRLASNGFSFNGTHNAWYAGSTINGDNTSTASAFGFFGPADNLTAYGYCLTPGV